MIAATVAERAALLVAGRSELHDLESLLRGMGYPACTGGQRRASCSRSQETVALCIIDLRQNGEALRTARAVRAQHPQAVVIGIADPDDRRRPPTRFAPAYSTCCPARHRRATSKR